MTIEEAIKHAEEVAIDRTEAANNTPTEYSDYINICRECAAEHEQLAEWLKDYKRLLEERQTGEWIPREIEMFSSNKLMTYTCNLCDHSYSLMFNFCPNCGSDMRSK